MSETEAAAAALTQDILGEFVQKHGDENAARMLAEMAPDQPVAAPAPPVSSPPPAAAAAPPVPTTPEAPEPAGEQTPPALPDFTPLPDEELDELLSEAALEDEVEAEVEAEQEEYGESYDPDEARARKKQEKRIEFLEKQLVAKSKKDWAAENLRKYPLLATYFADEVKGISATSRRGFAREAQKMNDHYARALAQPLADIEALKSQTFQTAKTEARQEAAQQWGLPSQDPAGAPPGTTEREAALARARAAGAPLEERLKILGGILPQQQR